MSVDLRPRASAAARPASQTLRDTGTLNAALRGSERLFWEASERALRQPKDKLVLVLHLSRLRPRPHHLRVACVLLQDAASRAGGQVFTMRNQDVVLLCTRPAAAGLVPRRSSPPFMTTGLWGCGPEADLDRGPEGLPATLARVFSADGPATSPLVSVWYLDRDVDAIAAYLAERARSIEPAASGPPPARRPIGVAGVQAMLSHTPLALLVTRHTGMSLGADPGRSLADRLAPAFCELAVVLPVSGTNMRGLTIGDDPCLHRHFTSGLDEALIQLIGEDFAIQGHLTRAATRDGLPIHIELGLQAVLSTGFARLCRKAADHGVRFGVAVSPMQACADLDLLDNARLVLDLAGCDLVLGHVEPAALAFMVPSALQPDLLKLTWTPSLLAEDDDVTRTGGSLAGIDPARIVLQGVQSEAAFVWAQARGITLFAGPLLDQIQTAMRMGRCHGADACTIRQCRDRASAADAPGRAGCTNPGLLDDGFGTG